MPDSAPYRITVVCLGNICRSPMAEAVLRQRIHAAGLHDAIELDSAGTGDWHLGYPVDPRARDTLAAAGYPAWEHTSRQITPNWFAEIDLVLAMDDSNYADLERLIARSGMEPELRMMRSFDPQLAGAPEPSSELSVPDPYYGGDHGFVEVLAMLERASDGLMRELPARLGR